jgi:hypothetical protein
MLAKSPAPMNNPPDCSLMVQIFLLARALEGTWQCDMVSTFKKPGNNVKKDMHLWHRDNFYSQYFTTSKENSEARRKDHTHKPHP